MIGAIASLAGPLISAASRLFGGKKQYKQSMADIEALGTYNANPLAEENLALAKNLYGGRMAGAAAAQENILDNQSNSLGVVENNATDSSQVLSALADLTGRSNDAFTDLATKESMDKANRAGLVFDTSDTVINEGDKVFGDRLRQVNDKRGVRAVKAQNDHNAWNDVGEGLGMFGNMYDQGAFKRKK